MAAIGIGVYASLLALSPSITVAVVGAIPLLSVPAVWWAVQTPQRWLGLFFATALLLPPLPIAIGDSGPHPALAVVALGLFVGLLRLHEWRRLLSRDRMGVGVGRSGVLALALGLFLATLLLSVCWAAIFSGPTVALASLARVALFGISAFVFAYALFGPGADQDRPWRMARLLLWIATAAALFACLDFYYQWPAPSGFGPQYVWLDLGVFRRAQGLFYEASTLGNFCAFFLVMIAVAMFHRGLIAARPILFLAAAIFAVALIFSYSRGSVVNLAVALLVLAYLRRRATVVRGKRVRWDRRRVSLFAFGLLTSVGLGTTAVYLLFPQFAQSYWLRLTYSLEFLSSAPERVFSGRLASWQFLVDFISEHPWQLITGIGYKTLPYSDYAGRPVIADNMFLSLLVETGFLGLAAFLILNFFILRSALNAARSDATTPKFFGTWIFCFWIGELVQMLSGDLFTYWRVLPLFFWVLAVAVREHERSLPRPVQ